MQRVTSFTIDIDGRTFTYRLDGRRGSSIRIRVLKDNTLSVSIPFGTTKKALEESLLARKNYILSLVDNNMHSKSSISTRVINLNGHEITYTLEYKSIQKINLYIKENGTMRISAPFFSSVEYIEDFITSKAARILSAIGKAEAYVAPRALSTAFKNKSKAYLLGEQYTVSINSSPTTFVYAEGSVIHVSTNSTSPAVQSNLVNRFLDKSLLEVIHNKLNEMDAVFNSLGMPQPEIKLRRMKACWGTCHIQQKAVILNKSLRYYPKECAEYVLIHEMCHFVHPNHSIAFKNLLTSLLPNWRETKKELEKYSHSIGI